MADIIFENQWTRIICGDVLEVLGSDLVPRSSIQMAMTSVPYLRIRKYPAAGSWGWEESVPEWVDRMHKMGLAVAKVLKAEGSFWLNAGDKWGGMSQADGSKMRTDKINRKGNLMMLPERMCQALTDDETFTLINKVVWWKRNRAPQSYQRKLIDVWEPLYHLVKNPDKYKYNRATIGVEERGGMDVISQAESDEPEEFSQQTILNYDQQELWKPAYDEDHPPPFGTQEYADWYNQSRQKESWHDHSDDARQGQHFGRGKNSYGKTNAKGMSGNKEARATKVLKRPEGANPGDVWDIPVKTDPTLQRVGMPSRLWPAWPLDLCTIPLLATTDPNDIVLDPFCGSGSLGVAAKQLGRRSILIDIDVESCRVAAVRVMKAAEPLKQISLV